MRKSSQNLVFDVRDRESSYYEQLLKKKAETDPNYRCYVKDGKIKPPNYYFQVYKYHQNIEE